MKGVITFFIRFWLNLLFFLFIIKVCLYIFYSVPSSLIPTMNRIVAFFAQGFQV